MHVGLIAAFLILAVALIAGGLYLFASGLTARAPRPETPTLCGGPRPREVMHEAGARLSYPRRVGGAAAPRGGLCQRRPAGALRDQPEADLDDEP